MGVMTRNDAVLVADNALSLLKESDHSLSRWLTFFDFEKLVRRSGDREMKTDNEGVGNFV